MVQRSLRDIQRWAAAQVSGHDRAMLAAFALLVLAGLLLALSASPVAADRSGVGGAFHFAWRQALFAVAGLGAFIAVCSLPPPWVRRVGMGLFALGLLLCGAVLLVGPEVNGAQRWLRFGPLSLQPVELLKPGLVIVAAWVLALGMRNRRFPGPACALLAYVAAASLLAPQPDLGQTAILGVVVTVLIVLSRARLVWLASLAVAAAGAGVGAYLAFPHVRERIALFFSGGGYQVERALDTIKNGGALGRGPGEGVFKDTLPDAHSDFVFAVAAEEFGFLASLGLLVVFAVVASRGLMRASKLVDPFAQLAACGLVALVAIQAGAHVAVNLGMAPAKGVTLPLVSAGGSSMLGAALTLGLATALVRARPGVFLYDAHQRGRRGQRWANARS